MDLVIEVYRLTALFPREETYGLISQMKRAATSIPTNVAEGAARAGTKELVHYLSVALGSASELDAHLEIAARLGYCANREAVQARLDNVSSQLVAMRSKLRAKARS